MAATRKNSSIVLALSALALTVSLLFLTASTEAPCPSKPTPSSPTATSGSGGGRCPVDALKLGVCADVLGLGLGGELTNLLAGSQSTASRTQKPCCELIAGLADLDATVCLCTAIRANVLGVVDLALPLQLGLLVDHCGKKLPAGFQCPN
uniref:Uncharacterized protein n=1 Tax=Avena sativa TaxID=4498 RepID=A0ACD5U4E3_AVESA